MSDLDAQVHAADPDRWLSSRLVPDESRRADLIALYALEAELAAVPARVSQPLLAEMRLTWWSEQLEAVYAGRPRQGHPVLGAIAAAVARHELPQTPLEALIEGQIERAHRRPHDLEALFVGPAQLAAQILVGPGHGSAVADAARVRGLLLTGQRQDAEALRPAANLGLRALPASGFPAVAHAALRDPDAPEPFKRLRLVWAALRGRI